MACGLKRGFSFFFHRLGEPFGEDRDHARQLLVAASPHDEIADTHWYRPDFDHALVKEAQAEGVIYMDATRLERLGHEGDGTILEGHRGDRPVRITAGFVIDATGPRGFLHHALGLKRRRVAGCLPTQGLYSHFESVERWDRLADAAGSAAISDRRGRATSRVSRRLDLDAPVQQRHHQRRRRADRCGGGAYPCERRRAGMGSPAGDVAVGRRAIPVCPCRRFPSFMHQGSLFAVPGWSAPHGRCCPRPPASSIRCCRPVFR